MNRLQWQQLAERWLVDAKSLLDGRRWSAAYYAAGYAVECGLKSCILARLAATPEIIFKERRFSEKCWTHDAEELIGLAGLKAALDAEMATNPVFSVYWRLVTEWSEHSRYATKSHWQAKRLYKAITEKANGVMPWIRSRW